MSGFQPFTPLMRPQQPKGDLLKDEHDLVSRLSAF